METREAQRESMMKAEPQKEHEWLHKLIGEWTYGTEATMEEGQPPAKFAGTESVRSLGASGSWPKARARCPAAMPRRR